MKKGDIIQKLKKVEAGTPLTHAHASEGSVRNWMKQSCQKYYNQILPYEVVPDKLNKGKLMAVSKIGFMLPKKAQVQWVLENEASIKSKSGEYYMLTLNEEHGWVVIEEATPTYQSSVASMTDEELKHSLDELRRKRVTAKKAPRARKTTDPAMNKNQREVKAQMDKLSPEKMAKLLAKLGG